MTEDPRLTPLAAALPASVPFVGPEAQERHRGQPFIARLGANESVFGPSPKAIDAMRAAAGEVWKYGDPESFDLRQAPTVNYHVAGYGGTLHKVPYTADHEDPERLIAKAREVGARLIYLSNPDNPMGTWHDADTIQRMIHAVPDRCLLILDEAYTECAQPGTAPALDPDDPRVIRMRTFSKGYGMAGARVGYGIGHRDTIRAFHKVRNHFGMNRIGQAGALAALADQDYLRDVQTQIANARDRIAEIGRAHGLTPIPSATNFVALDCGGDGALARATLEGLMSRGIFVRMPFVAPEDRCIRVTCGTDTDLDAFAAALPSALDAAHAKFR